MQNPILASLAVALAAAPVVAQTVTVPAIFANTEGGTTPNVWRAGTNRVQCAWDSSNFASQNVGHPIVISNVEFRLAGGLLTTLVTYPSVEIHLQDCAVNYLSLTTTFATNRSAPLGTPNYAGPVSTQVVSGSTPNDYFISIPLTTPFTYNPDSGADLLMEIVILAAPSPNTGHTINTGFNTVNHLCNSVRSVGSTVALTGTLSAFCPVARFTYTDAPAAAKNITYGAGCYDRAVSIYEEFAAGANDLSGQTVTLVQNGNGGYTATTTAGAVLTAPTVPGLALGDDVMSASIPLPFTFDFPGGNATSIQIDSNGSILLGVTGATSIGGSAATMLGLPGPRLCPSMQDLLPDAATNVDNVFVEPDPANPTGAMLITWLNVPCFNAVLTGLTSTFQVALIDNGTNDTVEFRYSTLTNDSSSNAAVALTGWTIGNGANDPGSSDLTAGPVATFSEIDALSLSATGRPLLGQATTYDLDNIPAPGVTLHLWSLGQVNPGASLAGLGAPGCSAFIALPEFLSVFNIGLPTNTVILNIPNDPQLVGLAIHGQGVALVPTANALGAITSNGVSSTIGTL
ncbi:MAG: nidogen-like domain-containing protein [Planctomycetota bacterium]